ncbi:sporulation protein YpjB [Paenibacillus sp. FA6]|uniref:sporulation protein YpjB n=1 Tax=Paenibacillus sp. FA6 TaxID=3413029 RepID=UPI003F659295
MLRITRSHPIRWLMVSFMFMFITNQDVIWSQGSSSAPTDQAAQLNIAAERLYRDVVDGDLTEVRLATERVEQLFTSSSFEGLTEVEGIQALAECIVEVKVATAQLSIQPEEWLKSAAKLRLAADSLSNKEQPLWHQYYKVIREDLSMMQNQLNENNKQGLKKAYDSLQAHYELIRPAVVIQKKPFEINMMDSWISFVGGMTTSTTSKVDSIRNTIVQGEEMVNTLFGKKRDEPAFSAQLDLHSYQNGIWIGGLFILSTLIYVGYRKYQGEQKLWW